MNFQLEQLIPVLWTRDVAESIEFYTTHLGFALDWQTEGLCSLSRDGRAVMFSKLEKEQTSVLWIGVDDILPIYDYLSSQKIPCLHPPQNMTYAHDMRFADPSGNVLWFGSDPLEE